MRSENWGRQAELICFEDDHLLVVDKPAGWNTHAPSPYAGEGLYDWLRHREPRWATLAIMHRLDKETSGLLLFTKTSLANRALAAQFASRQVHKRYLLVTDRAPRCAAFSVRSALVRVGEKYVSRPIHPGAEVAETRFEWVEKKDGLFWIKAEPITGRTHQIRVHAADEGIPILGDVLYGGSPAARTCLHAHELVVRHPVTGQQQQFAAQADFFSGADRLRGVQREFSGGDVGRLVNGASDGWPGWYVDRLGEHLLSQSELPLSPRQREFLIAMASKMAARGIYHKRLRRHLRQTVPRDASPRLVSGLPALDRFLVRENGVLFELSLDEGYSIGLFLDQRDNRRRFRVNHVAAGFPLFPGGAGGREVLNTFAYTCSFSVCAALAGARTTSLDLSKKYIEWGQRNFRHNDLDPTTHDFIFGDAFEWLRRLARKRRAFDAVVLDPPTFSQSKTSGVFQAEKDFGPLASAALSLVKPGGVLFASSNALRWAPERFLAAVLAGVAGAQRRVVQQHYVPQPPDFPVSRAEPAYLKTVWLRIE